jgi:hypothetical protein
MKLSKHFSLDELVFSQTAARLGIDNSPTQSVLSRLALTASRMDAVRDLLGFPVLVSSGFRCRDLNEALRGSPSSSHLTGEAVDFICPGFGSVRQVFDALRRASLRYDQLIVEYGRWVHIGFGAQMRGETLAYNGDGYREIT